jgi:hypothetical protein
LTRVDYQQYGLRKRGEVAVIERVRDARAEAIGAAEDEIFRRFFNRWGYVLDYAGLNGEVDYPSAEDMRESRPNGMSWWSPVENGAFFTGLLLAGLSRQERTPKTIERARAAAAGLMRLASVGKRRGFIARAVADDGVSHPVVGSDDQTIPWLYGLWCYTRSGIPSDDERHQVEAAMRSVCEALRATGWAMPTDGGPHFGYRGSWAHFNFIHAARLLFAHRIMAEIDPEHRDDWLELYYERLHERDHNKGPSRLEVLRTGAVYLYPGSRINYPENPPFWISAASQAALRELRDLEEDSSIRAIFDQGLAANAAAAMHYVGQYRWFDNDEPTAYRLDWRFLNEHWRPQLDIDAALDVANTQRPHWFWANPRKVYEEHTMREPLWAAWVVELSDAPSIRSQAAPEIAAALQHYRWHRLYSSTFFIVVALSGMTNN